MCCLTKQSVSAMVFPVTFQNSVSVTEASQEVENRSRISLNVIKKRRCQKNERTAYPQGC